MANEFKVKHGLATPTGPVINAAGEWIGAPIPNNKLVNSTITVNGQEISLGGSFTVAGATGPTGPTGVFGVILDTFTGNGVTTAYTLSEAPLDENHTIVVIEGVTQLKSTYSISGTTLTFSSAPPSGYSIEVTSLRGGGATGPVGSVGATGPTGPIGTFGVTFDTFTGNGNTTVYSLGTTPVDENHTIVAIEGVLQMKDTYSLSGSTLTFSTAPPNNYRVEVISLKGGGATGPTGPGFSATYQTRTATGNGVTAAYTISSGHTVDSLLVFLDGACQTPTTDYTVSGTTLTFVQTPSNGVKIQIRELPL